MQQAQSGARRKPVLEAWRLACETDQRLNIIKQCVRHEHLRGTLLQGGEFLWCQGGLQLRQQFAPVPALQQGTLGHGVRVAQFDAHQEAVELGFRQGESADLVGRILGGDDEERFRQLPGDAFRRHLVFFHCFQQRTLRLGRGAIDLVGKDQLGKDRAGVKLEAGAVAIIDGYAQNIRGQQVAGELDALEMQPQCLGQHMRQGGFPHAGQIFDQQMAASQQAGEREANLYVLAEYDLGCLIDYMLDEFLRHLFFRGEGCLRLFCNRIIVTRCHCGNRNNNQSRGGAAMNMIERVKNILLQPKAEWETISTEATSAGDLYKSYIAPLAAIGPAASIIGMSLIGISLPFVGTFRVPISSSIAHAVTSYVLTLVGVFIIALIIDALAPTFGGEKNQAQALKVAAYASTPSWVAGIVMILPVLGVIALLAALYGLYLLYLGLPLLMKAPQEKAIGYTAVVVVAAIVVMMLIGAASGMFVPTPSMPIPDFAPR